MLLLLLSVMGCRDAARDAFQRAADQLPAAEAEARRLGLPLSEADIVTSPPVRPEDDALPVFQDAAKAWRKVVRGAREREEVVLRAIQDPTPQRRREAESALLAASPALDLAAKAAAKPQMSFQQRDLSFESAEENIWKGASFRGLVKGLVLRAQFRAQTGDTAGSLRDFRSAFGLSGLVGSAPELIPGLVGVACDAITVRGMERAVTLRPMDLTFHAALGKLAAERAATPFNPLFHLRGEVILGLSAAEQVGNPGDLVAWLSTEEGASTLSPEDASLLRKIEAAGIPKEVLQRAYRTRILEAWTEVFAELADGKSAGRKAVAFERAVEKHTGQGDPTLALNQMLLPGCAKAGIAYAKREANLMAFQGLVAVLKFRAERGRYPESLAEAGVTSRDPFSGGAFRLLVAGESVSVYSVGHDRVDDGGREPAPARRGVSPTFDVGCKFPRALRQN